MACYVSRASMCTVVVRPSSSCKLCPSHVVSPLHFWSRASVQSTSKPLSDRTTHSLTNQRANMQDNSDWNRRTHVKVGRETVTEVSAAPWTLPARAEQSKRTGRALP